MECWQTSVIVGVSVFVFTSVVFFLIGRMSLPKKYTVEYGNGEAEDVGTPYVDRDDAGNETMIR